MNTLRRIAAGVYLLLLLGAGALCVWGMSATLAAWGAEERHHTLERGSSSVAGLIVVLAFLATLMIRGFKFKAMPLFVLSWVATVGAVSFAMNGYMKAWSPAAPVEATQANRIAVVALLGLLVFNAAAVWLSGRRVSGLGG